MYDGFVQYDIDTEYICNKCGSVYSLMKRLEAIQRNGVNVRIEKTTCSKDANTFHYVAVAY